MKRTWFIILGLLVVIVLLWKPCNQRQKEAALIKKISDSLAKKYAEDTAISHQRERTILHNLELTRMEKAQKDSQLAATNRKLTSANGRIRELSGDLDAARVRKDTPSYYKSCDSLQIEAKSLVWTTENLQKQVVERDSIHNREIGLLNEQMAEKDRQRLLAERNYAEEKRLLNRLYFDLKPRNRLFVGFGAGASVTGSFYQAGVGGLLETKANKVFGASVGITNRDGFYGDLRAYIPIKFHK